MKEVMKVDCLEEETVRMVKRLAILRVSTKHINLWVRQLEVKRNEIGKLAQLLDFVEIQEEIGKEKSLERWARRCTNYFTKKTRRILYGEIDNMVWSDVEKKMSRWCQTNKVYDQITEKEIEEIWNRESPEDDEPIRLNGKYVWETAKRVCNFINSRDDLISISSFGEYRVVMKK